MHWHQRGADEVIARYAALDGVVPDGARAIALGDPIGETAFLLPRFGALALGDVVLGGDGIEGEQVGDLRVCPPGWYGRNAVERAWYDGPGLRGALRRLAQEGAERLLVSHGTPVLTGGAEALRSLAERTNGRRAA